MRRKREKGNFLNGINNENLGESIIFELGLNGKVKVLIT